MPRPASSHTSLVSPLRRDLRAATTQAIVTSAHPVLVTIVLRVLDMVRWAPAVSFLLAMVVAPALAHAEDSSAAGVITPTPPRIGLHVKVTSATGPWVVIVRNDDSEPVRMIADTRLLRLLVRPQGKGYTECALPVSMRENDRRELLLEPGKKYQEEIDPRLFCFGKVIDEMAEGTSVTGFLGYPVDRSDRPPFVVEPARDPSGRVPIRRLVSNTTWLVAKEGESPQAASQVVGDGSDRLVVETPRFIDAKDLREVAINVTVRNPGSRSVLVRLRADQLTFSVTPPNGNTLECGRLESRRALVPDFYHSVRPKGRETLSILLGEVCPRQVFDQPGIYQLKATLRGDPRGPQAGSDAVVADISAKNVTLVRLQRGRAPYYRRPPVAETAP